MKLREFWLSLVFMVIGYVFLFWLMEIMHIQNALIAAVIFGIASASLFTFSIALLIKRLHDLGKSGWYLLLFFIPQSLNGLKADMSEEFSILLIALIQLVLILVLILPLVFKLCFKNGKQEKNKYGEYPKDYFTKISFITNKNIKIWTLGFCLIPLYFLGIEVSHRFINNKFVIINNQGLELYENGEHEKAIEIYEENLKYDEDKIKKSELITFYSNLAMAKESNGDTEEAIEIYKKVIELDSNNFMAHNSLGVFYLDFDELGIKNYKEALYHNKIAQERAVGEDIFVTKENLALSYFFMGEYLESKILFLQLEKGRNSADVQSYLGFIAYIEEDFVNADTYFNNAIKIDSSYYDNLNKFITSNLPATSQ